jgi:hypothetical protein
MDGEYEAIAETIVNRAILAFADQSRGFHLLRAKAALREQAFEGAA